MECLQIFLVVVAAFRVLHKINYFSISAKRGPIQQQLAKLEILALNFSWHVSS